MPRVDLNCDMGESFGHYRLGNDEAILDFVTSANIACGFHAGDPRVMRETVALAADKGVAIGAHPGFRDLEGFGRRFIAISPEDAYDLVIYQVGALYGFVHAAGMVMQHVKAHGALYNAAALQGELADAVAQAVKDIDPNLVLFALAGGHLATAGEKAGLTVANEAFCDRTYQSDGTLTPRGLPDALITDHERACGQAVRLVMEGSVRSEQNVDVQLSADTICIHGDGPNALPFARLIRRALEDSGINVKPVRAG